jgi:putative transposase
LDFEPVKRATEKAGTGKLATSHTMAHTFTNLLYHLIFATKDRYPWLDDEIRPRLWEYLAAAVHSEGGKPYLVNGVADHVHLFVRLPQDKALADVVRNLKANSSGWLHRSFPTLQEFAWQTGYGAFTVSSSQAPKLRQYIADQEAHHRRLTFKEELAAMLRAHEIEFEEKYLASG